MDDEKFAALEAAMAAFKDCEAAYIKMQEEASDALESAIFDFLGPETPPDRLAALCRLFFWHPGDFSSDWLGEVIGVGRGKVRILAGPIDVTRHCRRCDLDYTATVRSRSARDNTWALCPGCDAAVKAERADYWRAKEIHDTHEQAERLARVEALRALPYPEYLKTPEWQDRRRRCLRAAWYRCQLCNAKGVLDVHHRSYNRLGAEADEDLIVLCRPCHATFHGRRRLSHKGG